MNNEQPNPNPELSSDSPNESNGSAESTPPPENTDLRSPVRPTRPEHDGDSTTPKSSVNNTNKTGIGTAPSATNPHSAMKILRRKMEAVANEFSNGKINRAQFNALYGRYSEQRSIIERLMQRNPNSQAWKQVMGFGGQTGFLRQHFEAQPLHYLIYYHNEFEPIVVGGKHPPNLEQVNPVLEKLWQLPNRPPSGLARRKMDNSHWLVLALGKHTITLVMFLLEPSVSQAKLVHDLHEDFEHANRFALQRHITMPDRMVFPQRGLVEGNMS